MLEQMQYDVFIYIINVHPYISLFELQMHVKGLNKNYLQTCENHNLFYVIKKTSPSFPF